MASRSISETKRVRYLLGLSFPAEREQIESEYFEDDDAFQEMLTAEDDLIDAYARGELAGEERRRFERSFMSSLGVRNRVQFAHAFAGIVSTTGPVATKVPGTLLGVLKAFQSPRVLQAATIAGVIVFVTMLAWLAVDRTRMTNELRQLRAESIELRKQTEALQQSSDTERTRTSDFAAQLTNLRSQSHKRTHRERGTTITQRARPLPKVKTDGEKIAINKPEHKELIKTQDAILGNIFENRKITELPVLGRSTVRGTAKDPQGNVVSGATVTLTDAAKNFTRSQLTNEDGAYVFNAIPPGTYSIEVKAKGFKTASTSGLTVLIDNPTVCDMRLEIGAVSERIAVASDVEKLINRDDVTIGDSFEPKLITKLPLDGRNVPGLLTLQPDVSVVNGGRIDQSDITLDADDDIVFIPGFLGWIRFQIALETIPIHENYRVIIKTADDRPVTSVDWIEPLMPNQTIIDTPAIPTDDLPSGDYVLLLVGKEPDGSFVTVAEYSFKVIKY